MTGGVYLAFRAGGARWAVPLERVREAARLRELIPLPGAPAHIRGVALVRGEPFGVIEVAPRREVTPGPSRSPGMILVLEGHPSALAVDAVDGIEEVPASRIAAPPDGSRRLTGVVSGEDGFLSLLDLDALVSGGNE